MTVCIGALHEPSNTLVFACDTQLTTPMFASDKTGLKVRPVHDNWIALLAADDVAEAVGILEQVQLGLKARRDADALVVQAAFAAAYASRIEEHVNAKVLGNLGIKRDEFRLRGRSQLGPQLFAQLSAEILQFQVRASFLVGGHDPDGRAHLFTVDPPGLARDERVPGFAAIGSGAYMAATALYFHGLNSGSPLWRIKYQVAEAKFMAERDALVGSHTIMFLKTQSPLLHIVRDTKPLFDLWEREGAPRIPASAEQAVAALAIQQVGATGTAGQ